MKASFNFSQNVHEGITVIHLTPETKADKRDLERLKEAIPPSDDPLSFIRKYGQVGIYRLAQTGKILTLTIHSA